MSTLASGFPLPQKASGGDFTPADADLPRKLNEMCILAEARAEQLRDLSSQLTLAENRERQKLSQLLHDDMQQILVAAKYNLEALLRQSPDKMVTRRGRMIDGLLDDAIERTRSLSWQLCPPILKTQGLSAALHWLARDMAAKNILHVHCRCPAKADPQAEDVQVLLYQSASELLLNIAKHSGVNEATVTLEKADGQVRLHVSDRGRGFDPAALKAKDRGDTHFGLITIRQRVECLGGSVKIESRPGYGTCIELSLPAAAVAAAVPAEQAPPAVAPRRSARKRVHGKVKLLLVDDHEIVRKGLAELLRAEPDFQVVAEAVDGKSAIELVGKHQPHIVVMDVTIPEMDGLEATRRIVETAPGVKVIGLSMHEAKYMQSAMLRAGAAMYLNKVGPPAELISAIRRLVPNSPRSARRPH